MQLTYEVTWEHKGLNLYRFLRDVLPRQDRRMIRSLLSSRAVKLNGGPPLLGRPLKIGDLITVEVPGPRLPERRSRPSRLPVLYEDDAVLAVAKPSGLSAVKERERRGDTALDLLRQTRDAGLDDEGKGLRLVHRLDRDTSGVLVLAKGRAAKRFLTDQFTRRLVLKEYWALVNGHPVASEGVIDEPLAPARHGGGMRIAHTGGKEAVTEWEVTERFRGFARLRARPRTGRTHQIRVHLAHIGLPVLCDRHYGGGEALLLSALKPGYRLRRGRPEPSILARLALHAGHIRLATPATGRTVDVECPLPPDLERVLEVLRKYASIADPQDETL